MLCRKQDATLRIDLETPHTCGDTAGESRLAWGIEEQEHAFADSVALGAGPKANPLRDGQILSWSSSANRILDVECVALVRLPGRGRHGTSDRANGVLELAAMRGRPNARGSD